MLYSVYKTLATAGSKSIGFSSVSRVGKAMAVPFRAVARSRFRLAADAIAFHLEKNRVEAERLAARSISENFTSFLEILLAQKVDERFIDERLEIVDPESFEAACRAERPYVFATAHLGAWELLSGIMSAKVSAPSKQVVVRKPKDEALHRLMMELRSVGDVEILEHRNAIFRLLKSLKRGGVAAFLVDHNCSRDEAVFLPFFNRTAAVNAGPALLAVRAGALVMPVFLVRTGKGKYRLLTEKPLDTASLEGERQERVREVAEFYTSAVERRVREYPEQWFWMHRRWKTQPEQ